MKRRSAIKTSDQKIRKYKKQRKIKKRSHGKKKAKRWWYFKRY